jgi:hypothetical protein
MNRKLLTLAFGTLLAAGTAATASAQLVVRIGPPPHHDREVIPPPPPEHRDWAWHAGYQRWDGQRYVWVPGQYEEAPHPHAHWVDGHWSHRGGGYVWVEGHWR